MSNTIVVSFKAIDEAWDKQLSNYTFDIYHLSGWLKASTVVEKGEAHGIVAEYKKKKIFFAIIKRKIDHDSWDATTPYGYGGPVVDSAFTAADIEVVLEKVRSFLFDEGCVSWFIRLHPIINKQWSSEIGKTVIHGPSLISDLTKSEQSHWDETTKRHRKGIKKALANNVVTKIERLSSSNVEMFSKIYTETMKNVAASPYYFFEDKYFYELCDNLNDRLLLITAYYEETAISSLICTICEETGIIQLYLGGRDHKYERLESYRLINHVARNWGREKGYKHLHFGSGVGAKLDPVYQFKKGFSSSELDFKTHRITTNSKKYQQLVAKANLTTAELKSDFYPLYRKRVN